MMQNKRMANIQDNESVPFDSRCKPDTSANANKIWLATFIFVGTLIAFSNLATILTFIINRRLRRRSVYCLINLAVADMLYGGSLAAFFTYEIYRSELTDFASEVRLELVGARMFILITPGLCLVLVALERLYVTFCPIRHLSTKKSTYVTFCLAMWILSAIFALALHLTPDPFYSYLTGFCLFIALLLLLVIISSYSAIFVKVKLQRKRIQRLQQRKVIQGTQKRERHLAMTMFLVTILTLITWLPYLVIQVYSYVSLSCISFHIFLLTILVQFSNSIINPIVYVLRMHDFRRGLIALVFRCSRYQPLNVVYPLVQAGHRRMELNLC
ncbi:cannabinoid receptor 1-like [Actinia tenebrosa]|uniref:Cannabinoid receptor 1-like n=1 Tax=Actinia tenebrosa TaxID=6105 RepID=A0A6P8IKE9_ACTTE|nr:cannabinoid receptor 1-like [Actinia tenebrosa]